MSLIEVDPDDPHAGDEATREAVAARGLAGRFVRVTGSVKWRPLTTWAMRAVALVWLAAAVLVWARLLGLADGGASFTALPALQKGALVVFAVVYPVAAIGLWLVTSWGIVVWLMSVLLALAIHSVFADRFGVDVGSIAMNAIALVTLGSVLAAQKIHTMRG